jgi:2-keto-3-deoxy-L-rhamnonate aldolase RhmA
MSMNCYERIKSKLQRSELVIGIGVSLKDGMISEIMANAGFDFLWIDMEHTSITLELCDAHVSALRGTETAAWVRVPSSDPVAIKPIVDLNPAGIIVPQISNTAEAARAVAACRYPPHGIRGYGPRRGIGYGSIDNDTYLERSKEDPLVILQIEHIDAVNQIEAILDTPGIGSICFGPNDLSGSMGLMGQTSHPRVMEAIDRVIEACKRRKVWCGTSIGYSPELVRRWISKGINWIQSSGDWMILRESASLIAKDLRSIKPVS